MASPIDQIRYDDAKSRWLQAVKLAQEKKDEAWTAYEKDKADGITEDSFSKWVNDGRCPVFTVAYDNYGRAETAYTAAWENLDNRAFHNWRHNREQKYLRSDNDERNFLIYTGEE